MKRIKSIEIKNSSFFKNGFKIEFSDKLNCVMGGRGTGKSTLLFFIESTVKNEAEYNSTIHSILKNNLGEGEIILNVEDNSGNGYNIIKTFNDEPQPYLMPSKRYISIEKIQNDLDCDIYEAFAIEKIGKNCKNRLDLIDKMLKKNIDILKSNVKLKQIELNENSNLIKSENSRLKNLENNLSEYEGLDEKFESHKENEPKDIIEDEKKQFEDAVQSEKVRTAEKRFADKIVNDIKGLKDEIIEKNVELNESLSEYPFDVNYLNTEILNSLTEEVKKAIKYTIDSQKNNINALEISISKINKYNSELKGKHEIQHNEFIILKNKLNSNKEYYSIYNKLSRTAEEKRLLEKDCKDLKSKINKLKEERNKLVSELNEIKKSIFQKRYDKINELNMKFNGSIKIILSFGGITDEYEESLRNALRGSGMHYNILIPKIVRNIPADKFAQIIHKKDKETLKEIIGIDEKRADELVEVLHETDSIYEIESIYSPDLPDFLLKVDSQERDIYKKSDDLSTGQRCTTVLPIIFEVSDNPLIIDQPEDNLDNKYIAETIHKIIREQKNNRQLIFITHNPNIPVLSEAEKNIFLNYKDKNSSIESEGKVEDVKRNIINLLEGGDRAFRKRKELYGY